MKNAADTLYDAEQLAQRSIAIIGIGCCFPQAETAEDFWQLLRDGVDVVADAPTNRIGIDYRDYGADTPTGKSPIENRGGFIDTVDQFDPRFFGLSPEEAAVMDPQQRLLLEVTWQTLEDAGQVPARLAGSRTGIFVGVAPSGYGPLSMAVSEPGSYGATNSNSAIAANRISFQFNFRGPSVTINTACSSALVAVHQACQSLILGESSLAIAGGINLMLSGQRTGRLAKAGLISTTGHCHSFDGRADGYVRGEGVGLVLLKPLEQAEAAGDRIYAVIRSSAINHNGRGNGLTAPHPNAQKELLKEAYRRARLSPTEVQYIEAHSSSTPIGDALELKAMAAVVKEVPSADAEGPAKRSAPCLIGSLKPNLGNLETASGIASLIKVALAIKHQQIPPTLYFQRPNPHVDFERAALKVQTQLTNWPLTCRKKDRLAIAGVSGFGLGGTNAHIVMTSALAKPAKEQPAETQSAPAIFVLSAKSERALSALAQRYLLFLSDGGPDCSLLAVCYAAATRRSHFAYRLAIVADSLSDLHCQLHELLARSPKTFQYKISRRLQQDGTILPYPAPEPSLMYKAALRRLARQWLKGVSIDWSCAYNASIAEWVDIPTYPFDRQSYWICPSQPSKAAPFDSAKSPSLKLASKPVLEPDLTAVYRPAESSVQKSLVDIWETLLQVDSVGIDDNFFELGGQSLLAAQVISRIRDVLSVDLSLRTLFDLPTIALLSAEIEHQKAEIAESSIHCA